MQKRSKLFNFLNFKGNPGKTVVNLENSSNKHKKNLSASFCKVGTNFELNQSKFSRNKTVPTNKSVTHLNRKMKEGKLGQDRSNSSFGKHLTQLNSENNFTNISSSKKRSHSNLRQARMPSFSITEDSSFLEEFMKNVSDYEINVNRVITFFNQ
jgi:hypothetical protein